jgi:hypothetical protein
MIYLITTFPLKRNNVVAIATDEIRLPTGARECSLHSVQTGSGAHRAF